MKDDRQLEQVITTEICATFSGYGNVTCKTDWGRIATILYAIVGTISSLLICLKS